MNSNAEALVRIFGEIARDQLPFASAQALTTMAFEGRKAAQAELAQSLVLRNRFSTTGIQVNRAEKADWPNQKAEVGVEARRSYLIDHVLGGKRQGGAHGRAILEEERLRGPTGRIARKDRPGALLKLARRKIRGGRPKGAKNGQRSTPLPFVLYSSRWGNEVLARRTGPGRYPLQIIYAFKRGVSIKREFEMDVAVQLAIQGTYSRALGKALERAIATAKSKAERSASMSAGAVIDSGR